MVLLAFIFTIALAFCTDTSETDEATTTVEPETVSQEDECGDERYKLNDERIIAIQNAWGGALENHREKIVAKYNQSKPNDYRSFTEYKVNEWRKPFGLNRDKMDCGWKKYGWAMDTKYDEIKSIHNAMIDLNTATIYMTSYLDKGEKSDGDFVENKLKEIKNISSKYSAFKPKKSDWFNGATLQNATAIEWQNATDKNRVASAAIVIAEMGKKDILSPAFKKRLNTLDDLRLYAEELKSALDEAFKKRTNEQENINLYSNQTVVETSVIMATMMGWTK